MKLQNINTVKYYIARHRKETGSHDWDGDLDIIKQLMFEYSTTNEDLIMSVYRKVVKTWD